ncbi:DUF2188 domain-containing protein [Cupriavidus sp.]|jgi:Uncharacterized protein conserved in bacteria (DUF2188)|uniref:DUF2188 domain-containing protein n=1 Tax=Cupriavidus sp. TaxID=1873897 RepID=UPI0025BA3577|nr:DUF2188 domain-containing protein [Cupriavidus sp.]MCA3194228.1 DUF2188 domain-containing protein [Cupriavidus sp.]MCA3198134.1 DUF2188 domain-containing protein [Cupriavidus sp.]MCA3205540.1 DUF2188 domain-containing protein [Cupriavidus sp.]MCA3209233.1 DUF2188 domain-containing protein [Cupriavidus sp.]MCA3233712.1 DUF2188 domain-containing protein [Cupriavidus sp.]
MSANIHVVPAGEGWAVEAAGSGRRTFYVTQEEAIRAGWDRAKKDKVELLIHNRNGQLHGRNSLGHDPRDAKG